MLRRGEAHAAGTRGEAAPAPGRERPSISGRGSARAGKEDECPDWNTYIGRAFANGCEPLPAAAVAAAPLRPPQPLPRCQALCALTRLPRLARAPCAGHRYMSDEYLQAVVERNLGRILLVLVLCILVLLGSVRSFLRRSLRRRCERPFRALPWCACGAHRVHASALFPGAQVTSTPAGQHPAAEHSLLPQQPGLVRIQPVRQVAHVRLPAIA
jgi:hypothetical protein